jgi:hypothetical protein
VIAEGPHLEWRTEMYYTIRSTVSEPPAMIMQGHNSPRRVRVYTHLYNSCSVRHSVKVSACEFSIPACVYSGFRFPDLCPEASLDLRIPGKLKQRPSNSVRGRLVSCEEDDTVIMTVRHGNQ